MEFKQAEQVAVRRRWILVLVDSSDGVTGKTGQTGTVQLIKNGGIPAASTNSIVEIDSTNAPGQYYIELTAGELDSLGAISIYYKAASTLAFHDRGYVSYNDPYASQGGFVAPSNVTGAGITKAQSDDLLKQMRKMIAAEFAKYEEEEDAEEVVGQDDDAGKLDLILAAVTAPEEPSEPVDLQPVLDAIAKIEKPKDYSKDFTALQKSVADMSPVMSEKFNDAVKDFQGKMGLADKYVETVTAGMTEMQINFKALTKTMEDYKTTLADQSNMDKRFDSMMSAKNDTKLEELSKKFLELQTQFVNFKYDMLEMLKFGKLTKK